MGKNIKFHKTIRLPDYDYSQPGAYFVTICTRERACIFGDIANGEMYLNELGRIIWNIWQSLPARYPQINLGPAVVMPNHFHGIVEIVHFVAAIHELPLQNAQFLLHQSVPDSNDPIQRRKMLLPKVMGYFKMNSARDINQLLNTPGTPVWQRDYYERIIRDEQEYTRIARYIENNPLHWMMDEEYVGE
jgi:putative transposase